MPDTLTTITHLINSPPGQIVAGAALAGIVWKFFERVEAVLTDNTKLEIAVWLLGVKVGQKLEPWPDTFARVFDRVFGEKHLSWRCFVRSSIASISVSLLIILKTNVIFGDSLGFEISHFYMWTLVMVVCINVLPGYLSMWETRWLLGRLRGGDRGVLVSILVLAADGIFTLYFALSCFLIGALLLPKGSVAAFGVPLPWYLVKLYIANPVVALQDLRGANVWYLLYPAFFTSIWLWLYAGSGFILKAAGRFDIGFEWFNRKFDIEEKPLQSIGLVAGALVALVYWAAVIVSRVVR